MFTDAAWERIFGLFVAEDGDEGHKIVFGELINEAGYKRLVL